MIYYAFPYVILLFFVFISYRVKGKFYKIAFFIGFMPAILLVILRGYVGTDTFTYVNLLSADPKFLEDNIEYLFRQYALLTQELNMDPLIALNILGGILSLLMYCFFSKDKWRVIIFSSLVFPIFYYDMTMNGIRYGFAFILSVPFILESVLYLRKISYQNFSFLLAVLNHKSSFLFFPLKVLRYLSIKYLLLLLIFSFIVFLFNKDYFLLKYHAYLDMSSPNILSGIQPLLLMFLLTSVNSYFYKNNKKRNFILFFIQIVCYLVTQVSYAGIRFQFLVLFYFIVILIGDKKSDEKTRVIYIVALYLIGVLGFILKSRNMIDSFGIGNSPFLPYVFY